MSGMAGLGRLWNSIQTWLFPMLELEPARQPWRTTRACPRCRQGGRPPFLRAAGDCRRAIAQAVVLTR